MAVQADTPVESGPTAVETNPPGESGPTAVKTNSPVKSAPTAVETNPLVESAPTAVKTNSPVKSAPTAVKTNSPVKSTPTAVEKNPPVESGPTAVKTSSPVKSAPVVVETNLVAESKPTAAEANLPVESRPVTTKTNMPDESRPTAGETNTPVKSGPTAVVTNSPVKSMAVKTNQPVESKPTTVKANSPVKSPTAVEINLPVESGPTANKTNLMVEPAVETNLSGEFRPTATKTYLPAKSRQSVENNPPEESKPVTEVKSPEKSRTKSPDKAETSEKTDPPSTSPTVSRYGRARKPKVSNDFIAHNDVKNFLASGGTPLNTTINNSLNINGSPAASLKQQRASRKNSLQDVENIQVNGIEDPKSDVRNFSAKSESPLNGDIKLSAEPMTPLSVASTPGNRGRKRKVQTPATENGDPAVVPVKVARPRGRPPRSSLNLVPGNSPSSLQTSNRVSSPKAVDSFKETGDAPVSTPVAARSSRDNADSTPRVPTPMQVPKPRGSRRSTLNTVPENSAASPQASSETGASNTLESMKAVTVSLPVMTPRNSLDSVGLMPKPDTPSGADSVKVTRPRGRRRSSLRPVLENPTTSPQTSSSAKTVATTSTPVVADATKAMVESAGILTTPTVVLTPLSGSFSRTPKSSATPTSEFVGHPEKKWLVGDMAWGCVGKHPYWPCIIMKDPVSKTHFNEKSHRGTIVKQYFLQFCADNGRHCWLSAKNLLEFESKRQFTDLQEKLAQDHRQKQVYSTRFSLKPHAKESWDEAAVEAEYLAGLSREDRIQHFQRLYPMETPKTKKDLLALLDEEEPKSADRSSKPSTSKASPSKTSQVSPRKGSKVTPAEEKMEVDETPESTPKGKSAKNVVNKQRKKRKRRQDFGPDFEVYCSKNFDRIADDHPHLKEEEINKYLQKVWLEMDDSQKLKYRSKRNETSVSRIFSPSTEDLTDDESDSGSTDGGSRKRRISEFEKSFESDPLLRTIGDIAGAIKLKYDKREYESKDLTDDDLFGREVASELKKIENVKAKRVLKMKIYALFADIDET